MRVDTILMTLSVAAIAAVTYFTLEYTLPKPAPELAAVTPENPPIVVQKKAADNNNQGEQ